MRRLFSPFVLALTALLAAGYAYAAWRLASTDTARWLLAVPFVLVWLVPVVYWVHEREGRTRADDLLHAASYLSMGWLTYVLVLSLVRDLLTWLTSALLPLPQVHAALVEAGASTVLWAALAALGLGALAALRGPHVRHVDIPIPGLHRDLDGLRIAQISDLHIGPTIGAAYVQRVVQMSNRLAPDLVALTGDIVDGSVARLAPGVAPLAGLQAREGVYLVLGNHDYYSGAGPWTAHFESLGLQVLRNEHRSIVRGQARLIVGGVVDPAVRLSDPRQSPRPDLACAASAGKAFRLLLAHNPKLAPLAEKAGFDLQLSGHTHAGQFFPWTLAVHLVHAPHVAGLSRSGRMWVYVSAGTGTWGPPVRLGTRPELTLVRLVRAPSDDADAHRKA
jgi:predicted MPP superfamily phosphohydrolase